jgi:hypothetical protein
MQKKATSMTTLFGLIALSLSTTASSAGYYVGRVVDKNNAPLQGVAVSLEVQKLSATSDAQGKFTLGTVAAGNSSASIPHGPLFTMAGSVLRFGSSHASSTVAVRLYSIQGRSLADVAVQQGARTCDLSRIVNGIGDGCFVVQVTFDNREEVVGLNRVDGAWFTTGTGENKPVQGPVASLAKQALVVDTLALSKTSFLTNRCRIADSSSNLGDITLYPAVAGTLSKYYGFDRYDFKVDQKSCIIVVPKVKPAPGNPWVWRSYFFDHKPYIDSILCARGYYMGYIDLPNLYGCPTAVRGMDSLYKYLTSTYGLSKKPLLIGISRGGLYIYNWARSNIPRVSCLYGDGACMDIIAWPCACYPQGGTPSPSDWATCKQVYGFASDDIAKAYTGNPYQNMRVFAEAKTPLIHVYGTADPAAIPSLNVLRARDSLQKYGGTMTLIAKPGAGHVHGVQAGDGALPGQADTLLNFLLRNTSY